MWLLACESDCSALSGVWYGIRSRSILAEHEREKWVGRTVKFVPHRNTRKLLKKYALIAAVVGAGAPLWVILGGKPRNLLLVLSCVQLLVLPVALFPMIRRYPETGTVMAGCLLSGPSACFGCAVPIIVYAAIEHHFSTLTSIFSFLSAISLAIGASVIVGTAFSLYLCVVGRTVLFVVHRSRRVLAPGQLPVPNCAACGYSLLGLSEDRCPECGMAFDVNAYAWPLEEVERRCSVGLAGRADLANPPNTGGEREDEGT